MTDGEGTQLAPPPVQAPAAERGPRAVVERQGVRFTLLGTAHVSPASAQEVESEVASGAYDAVAVELDAARHIALTDTERWAKVDLFQVLKQGKMGMVAVSLALGAFQQRLADQLGIEPGAEMRAAVRGASAAGLPLMLIDRDLGVTLKRVAASVPWWQRPALIMGVVASVFSRETIDPAEIEQLKQGDMLEATFAEFAERERGLYAPLISERDRYMARQLELQVLGTAAAERPQSVLVVIGAGHLAGLKQELQSPTGAGGERRSAAAAIAELEQSPPRHPLTRALPWLLVSAILLGFFIGFRREPDLGLRLMLEWVIINGGLAGLGAAIALAHPITILGTALAAPFTSLNPLVGAGFVAAGLELWLRKPSVGDFQRLRSDVTRARGWWSNRAARALLVFVLATLGSVLGTYLGGFRILDGLLR
jgi:pheromone shutdown-related protein TraB